MRDWLHVTVFATHFNSKRGTFECWLLNHNYAYKEVSNDTDFSVALVFGTDSQFATTSQQTVSYDTAKNNCLQLLSL